MSEMWVLLEHAELLAMARLTLLVTCNFRGVESILDERGGLLQPCLSNHRTGQQHFKDQNQRSELHPFNPS